MHIVLYRFNELLHLLFPFFFSFNKYDFTLAFRDNLQVTQSIFLLFVPNDTRACYECVLFRVIQYIQCVKLIIYWLRVSLVNVCS